MDNNFLEPTKDIDADYIVFDLETTSRNSKIAEIIEIAAIKVKNHNIVDSYSSLVKPFGSIESNASEVNNITIDILANERTIDVVLPEFAKFIGNTLLVGYNISTFDLPILRRYSTKYNIQLENKYTDVLYLARKKLDFLPNRDLSTVASYFTIDTTGSHRALNDCKITKNVYEALLVFKPTIDNNKKSNPRQFRAKHNEQTKALQQLHVLLLGIIADDVLTESEITTLDNWLKQNQHLSGNFPYDRIASVVNEALSDGILEQHELEEMLLLFKEYTLTLSNSNTEDINLTDKGVCLTGDFKFGDRKSVQEFLKKQGAIIKSGVTSKTDYLIIGELGSPDWSYGNYGSKYKKAKELQQSGSHIKIISEDNLFNTINSSNTNNMINQNNNINDDWKSKITYMLNTLIKEMELPEQSLHIATNYDRAGNAVTSYSICIYEPEYPSLKKEVSDPSRNSIVMNIKETSEEKIELLIRAAQFENIANPSEATIKTLDSDKANIHVIFSADSQELVSYIRKNVEYALKNYTSKASTFGCCSQFVACSDAEHCIHENKLYSKACMYRKHLDEGKIFYGKNKNV